MKEGCVRCLYGADTPSITFDAEGVCSYCRLHDSMEKEYPMGAEGAARLKSLAEEIKQAGRNRKYDCVVGVSGGCDSTYLLHMAKEMGLRPLAAHFDNTWNSAIATENIRKVCGKLKIDLFTIVVNNKEYDDLYHSFLKAGVPDIEAPTDIGLAVTLYKACVKHGIKYILEGHSFRTEGISPLGWLYMDGKYIASIQKAFGSQKLKTYPNMPLHLFIKWMVVNRIKKVRPLYFMDYRKEDVKTFLAKEYDWKWYGGHHLENRFTAFYHSYFMPVRFGIDQRVLGYAALARSGQMSREEGARLMAIPPACDPEIIQLVKKRLGLSDEDFNRLMTLPKKNYKDYPTYKKTFERLRPFFWLMYKLDMVPKSFYVKFTARQK